MAAVTPKMVACGCSPWSFVLGHVVLSEPIHHLTSGPPEWPPHWASGEGVRLESSRSGVRIPLATGFFSGWSHTSDLKMGPPVAVLPGPWWYRVSAGTGWPCVSIL